MELTLPQRRKGLTPETLSVNDCLVIIGANGAGKTRFTSAIVDSLGDRAYRMSALDALYNRRQTESGGVAQTALETLLARLMHDEMVNLIG